MTLTELSFELQKGDIVNYHYAVEKIKTTVIETRNINTSKIVKFGIGGTAGQYYKIMTVSRDKVIYFKRHSRGGYTHGIKKGKKGKE